MPERDFIETIMAVLIGCLLGSALSLTVFPQKTITVRVQCDLIDTSDNGHVSNGHLSRTINCTTPKSE